VLPWVIVCLRWLDLDQVNKPCFRLTQNMWRGWRRQHVLYILYWLHRQHDTLVCSSVYFMLVIKTIQRKKPSFLYVMNYGGARVNQHPPVHHLLDAHYIQEMGSTISTPFLCVKKQGLLFIHLFCCSWYLKMENKMKYLPSVRNGPCIWQWHMTRIFLDFVK
jgi:hypothetical protein